MPETIAGRISPPKWWIGSLSNYNENVNEHITHSSSSVTHLPLTRTSILFSENCERFEPRRNFKSRLSFIVRANVVLNRTVVFDSRTGCRNVSHCQQQQPYSGLRSPGRSNSKLNPLLKWLLGSNLSQINFCSSDWFRSSKLQGLAAEQFLRLVFFTLIRNLL